MHTTFLYLYNCFDINNVSFVMTLCLRQGGHSGAYDLSFNSVSLCFRAVLAFGLIGIQLFQPFVAEVQYIPSGNYPDEYLTVINDRHKVLIH